MTITDERHDEGLVVRHLKKYFNQLKAVDDVSFQLRRGEILGLIGPNGSGKTTTVNVVSGLLPPTGGDIFIDGINVTSYKNFQMAKAGLARTFQTVRLFHDLTVLENIEVAAVSIGVARREAGTIAEALLEELDLLQHYDRLAGGLPYGRQRLLEIARALALSPKYLFLDEPAAGLNEDESDDMLARLKRLPQERDIGVLIIDHDMRLIMRLCDRLHVLNYGKTIMSGTPEEIRHDKAVREAYFGEEDSL